MWLASLVVATSLPAQPPGTLPVGQGDRFDRPLSGWPGEATEASRPSSVGSSRYFVSEPVSVLSNTRSPSDAAPEQQSPFLIDFRQRPITQVTTNILPRSPNVPSDVAQARLQELGDISYESVLMRHWMGTRYCWDAPVLHNQPLYFEEVNLERYGYGPRYLRAVQPVLSGAHFFATVPTLPYQMAMGPPHRSEYALGHYRPGSPAPYRIQYPPLSIPGSLAEAGVIVGLIALIP
ncbi:MAG: hypothetical protein KJ000_19825 [Pirellulaceae bacterium]|nr:hypothetical protein [Pirellulaceae bacterium]